MMTQDEVVTYALATDSSFVHPSALATPSSPSRHAPLTSRESEVAALIARGYSNREIASALVITPRTADTHVRNIFARPELHSRAQVAVWIAERGLVAGDPYPQGPDCTGSVARSQVPER
jgi:DNA-binding NarL/FixJ family response regulator